MAAPRRVNIHLDEALRLSAERGGHNYFTRMRRAFEAVGLAVAFLPDDLPARLVAAEGDALAMFHMHEPLAPHILTTRRAYFYPFWRIEATARRWDWHAARAAFRPGEADPVEVARFCGLWRQRLFGFSAPPPPGEAVLVALQGLLTERREMQTMSPLAMLEATRRALPDRRMIVTLHPRVRLSSGERAALARIVEGDGAMELVTGQSERRLPEVGLVVTQNSSVALAGFFLHRPAVLFARIDFHHIASTAWTLGAEGALAEGAARLVGAAAPPPFDEYLHWFLQRMSINAGRPEAEAQILAAVRRHGWAV